MTRKSNKKIEQKILKLMEENMDGLTELSAFVHKNTSKKSSKHLQDCQREFTDGVDKIVNAYRILLNNNL